MSVWWKLFYKCSVARVFQLCACLENNSTPFFKTFQDLHSKSPEDLRQFKRIAFSKEINCPKLAMNFVPNQLTDIFWFTDNYSHTFFIREQHTEIWNRQVELNTNATNAMEADVFRLFEKAITYRQETYQNHITSREYEKSGTRRKSIRGRNWMTLTQFVEKVERQVDDLPCNTFFLKGMRRGVWSSSSVYLSFRNTGSSKVSVVMTSGATKMFSSKGTEEVVTGRWRLPPKVHYVRMASSWIHGSASASRACHSPSDRTRKLVRPTVRRPSLPLPHIIIFIMYIM